MQWLQVIQHGANRTIRKDPNGFYAIDSSKLLRKNEDPFALPQHCEQIFFHPDILDDKWLYVVHVTPRGRRAFEDQVSYEESPLGTTHVESEDEDKDAHEDENANEYEDANEVEEDNDVNHGEERDPMIENDNDVMEHDEDIDIDVCAMRDLYLDELETL